MTQSTNRQELINEAWRRGLLRWKLHKHQVPIYRAVWNAIDNKNTLKYVVNCSRRFGKTFTLVLVAVEYAIRNPTTQIRFAAPTAKALKKIIFPILKIITEDCPEDSKPVFKAQDDVLIFNNGSEIHFAGVDAGHAENLRGTASHLNILDEAGSMDDLDYVMRSILMPQTLTTLGTTILASTPSITPAHDYFQIYRECLEEKNVSEFTIYDNTSLTQELIDLYKKEAGGEDSTTFQREYLCKFIVDSELSIIPEWDETRCVGEDEETPLSQYWHRYVSLDSGVRDKTCALFAHYNFNKAVLYVLDEYVINGPEMTTDTLAREIRLKEKERFGDIKPLRRVADNNNLILVQDLSHLHDLPIIPTSKDSLEAMVNETRIWVNTGKVIVHPRCEYLIACLNYGVWRQSSGVRQEFARSKKYGHYDALAALIYMIRNVDSNTNPVPVMFGLDERKQYIDRDQFKEQSHNAAVFANMFKQ